MSVKAKATLSIDARTWEQAKRTYDNASERITELLEADLDVTQVEDKELLLRKQQELEEERNELQEEIEELQKELGSVESELSATKSSLERLGREKQEKEANLEEFEEAYNQGEVVKDPDSGKERKVPLKNFCEKPDDIPDKWEQRTGIDKEELWEEVAE
ncbi:MAG: chromosome segregation ATPase [Candidatus Nanohaloarchaea archaeon]|jgi:chromosome segregation ATPase